MLRQPLNRPSRRTGESPLPSSVPSLRASAQVTATASLDEIAASTEETLVLYDLAIGLTGHVDLGDVGDVIAKHLRRIVPASVIVFYVYESQTDDLVSMHAAGTHAANLVGLRIPEGKGCPAGSLQIGKRSLTRIRFLISEKWPDYCGLALGVA